MQVMPLGGGGGNGALPGDTLWSSVKLLVQPHAGDVGVAGLHDRGPDGRTATITTGSVAIVDDTARSPIWGAYADPSSAGVQYSDDAGLIPATGGDWCLEALYNRESATYSWAHGLFGTGATNGARHFQCHIWDAANNYWYRSGGSTGPGTYDPGDSHEVANGPQVESFIWQCSGANWVSWQNGHRIQVDAAHGLGASANWAIGWDAFNLFSDASGSPQAFYSGNLIALRFTHATRYDAAQDNIAVPFVAGFPERAG